MFNYISYQKTRMMRFFFTVISLLFLTQWVSAEECKFSVNVNINNDVDSGCSRSRLDQEKDREKCVGSLLIEAWGRSEWLEKHSEDDDNWMRLRVMAPSDSFTDASGKKLWKTGIFSIGYKTQHIFNHGGPLNAKYPGQVFPVYTGTL